jgi:hypothetical protein
VTDSQRSRRKCVVTTVTRIIAICAFAFVAGCSTAAQRQAALMMQQAKPVMERGTICMAAVKNNPIYEPLARRTPFDGRDNATLRQLADTDKANEEEIELIIAANNESTPCRQYVVEGFMKILPSLVTIFVESYHQLEIAMVDLIQRKITWGEYNQRRTVLRDDMNAKGRVEVARLERDFATSHYNELAQRQAALNALAQWADRQTALMQNQQIINRLNRPVITTCSGSAYYVNCTSR